MEQLIKKFLLLGMGAFTLTREKVESFLRELEKAPEKMEINDLLSELMKKGQQTRSELEQRIAKNFQRIIDQANIATRDDITRLEKKIEELGREVKKESMQRG